MKPTNNPTTSPTTSPTLTPTDNTNSPTTHPTGSRAAGTQPALMVHKVSSTDWTPLYVVLGIVSALIFCCCIGGIVAFFLYSKWKQSGEVNKVNAQRIPQESPVKDDEILVDSPFAVIEGINNTNGTNGTTIEGNNKTACDNNENLLPAED